MINSNKLFSMTQKKRQSTRRIINSINNDMPSIDKDGSLESLIVGETSSFFQYVDFNDGDDDDIMNDPDFLPSTKSSTDDDDSFASEDIRQAAALLERNLLEYDVPREGRSSMAFKRNTGKAYITSSGKTVKAREIKTLADCRMKCNTKITTQDQRNIFDNYWSLGKHCLRQSYISRLIDVSETKTKRRFKHSISPRNREFTNYYFLELRGIRTRVCQKCFRATLSETEQFIKTVVRKKINSTKLTIQPDLRGKGISNKISRKTENDIREHINSFPAYESRSRSAMIEKYFHSNLKLQLMYKLYCEKYQYQSVASFSTFSKLFKSMNIKFRKPKLHSCQKCENLKSLISNGNEAEKQEATFQLQKELEEHEKAASFACKAKDKDVITARNNKTVRVYSFDLQHCLPTPFLRTNNSHYRRQLFTYNLTVHDCVTNQAHCYMWNESIANRGSNEIASCVFQHLKTIPDTIRHLILYSRCFTGQNRNQILATLFEIFCHNSSIAVIDHKCLVRGRSHTECDADHAAIERKKNLSTVEIHHPRDWYQLVRSVGKKPFNVQEMGSAQFLNFSQMSEKLFNWDKMEFNWQNVKWLRFTREFGIIQFKTSLDESEGFKFVNIKKRRMNIVDLIDVPGCYSGPNLISEEKKNDLLELLPTVEKSYHKFYLNLRCGNVRNWHPDLSDED